MTTRTTIQGPNSQTFISQRLRLNYFDWGNHDKPPLILVHGGRDHARSWDWTAEKLAELHALQVEILSQAKHYVAPTGTLAY
ncbi:MAG: hypothetical protein AAFR32_03635, partial [Pseudomonadota bacterium]